MSDFKERLITEKAELDAKISKLDSFMSTHESFSKLDPVQMSLVNIQLQSMRTYSQILLERIALRIIK